MRTLDIAQEPTLAHDVTGTLMVPVDPRQPSGAAAEVARVLAAQASFDVELVSAVPPGCDDATVQRELRLRAREGDGGAPVRWFSLGDIDPAEGILDRASDGAATLLCLDTHARGAAAEMAFGSVSERVVRAAPVPVVACGPHVAAEPRYTRLLVGLDGSAQAEHALETAYSLALLLGAEVALREVLPPDVTMPDDVRETAYLSRVRQDAPVPILDYDTVHDRRPARALAEAAAEHPGTLLVVGTQGRSGFRRLRLGSVALDAVRHAGCPVVVVPPTA